MSILACRRRVAIRPFGFSLRCEALERRDLLAVVQFAFTAIVDSVGDSGNVLQGSVVPGATITGTFQYNTDLVDQNVDDPALSPTIGRFVGLLPDNTAQGASGEFSFVSDDSLSGLIVNTYDSDAGPGNEDVLNLVATGDTVPSVVGQPGIDFVEAHINLEVADGAALTSDALPADLNLDDFEVRELSIFAEDFIGSSNPFVIRGTITSLAKVGAPPPPDPNAEAIVANLYHDVLDRNPTSQEVADAVALLGGSAEPVDLARQILTTTEYRELMLNAFYVRLLERAPDPQGTAYWLERLAQGDGEQQVLAGIVASDEYFAAQGGAAQSFIDAVYADLLGRAGDNTGSQYWLGRLQAGDTRHAIALGFAAAEEFRALLVNDPSLAFGPIGSWYQNYLGRDADDGGRDYWVSQFGGNWYEVQARILAVTENLAPPQEA